MFLFDKKITKNKAISIELLKDANWDGYHLLNFQFQYLWKADHAGPKIEISIAKFSFFFSIYDIRHWDDEKDCWEKHE